MAVILHVINKKYTAPMVGCIRKRGDGIEDTEIGSFLTNKIGPYSAPIDDNIIDYENTETWMYELVTAYDAECFHKCEMPDHWDYKIIVLYINEKYSDLMLEFKLRFG